MEKRIALYQELLAKSGGSPLHHVNGLIVPFFIQQERVDKLKNAQMYPDDVWVVTYPKCGTTWMQQIVRLIRNNGVRQDDIILTNAIPWVETSLYPDLSIDNLPRPRAFKSHMPYDLCPCGPPDTTPCKYIYVTRNPKDVAVSYYFHQNAVPNSPYGDWDSFWEEYVGGKLGFGDYIDHLLSWWSHRDDENVLFMKYEDMKKDLPAAVSQVASFIGADISSDVIAKIATLTDFEYMTNDDTANYSERKPMAKPGSEDFMRKGKIGDWKNHLSSEQSAQMDAICAQRLDGTGLEFQYE